jgi:hypothetical protein
VDETHRAFPKLGRVLVDDGQAWLDAVPVEVAK